MHNFSKRKNVIKAIDSDGIIFKNKFRNLPIGIDSIGSKKTYFDYRMRYQCGNLTCELYRCCEVDCECGNSFCYMGKYITLKKKKKTVFRKISLFKSGDIINFLFNYEKRRQNNF